MSELRIRAELPGFPYSGRAELIEYCDRWFVVYEGSAHGKAECLIFNSNDRGEVTNWNEIAGGGGGTKRQTAIEELKRKVGPR